MPLNRRTAVIGSAQILPASTDARSLEELLFDVAKTAMKDAGLKRDEIEGIVVASNDQFDGRAISIMAASGSVGGVDNDILSTPSAGEHAFVMGVLRVASGLYETQLIVSWSPTEASSLSEAQRLGADPYFHRGLPLDELSAFALQAAAISAGAPEADDLAEPILLRNRRNGAIAYPERAIAGPGQTIAKSKPLRWPLREAHIAPPVTGVVALVLASEDFVRKRGFGNVAWVRGMGWATETAFLGDRSLAEAPALVEAARRAYEEAGVDKPGVAFDVVELTGATPYQELLACDVLGLSRREDWVSDVHSGALDRAGRAPINLSGGLVAGNAVFCAGLMRIAEAADQIRGRCGNHQLPTAELSLAHAASGFAMMYQTVVVFGKTAEGAKT